MSHQPRGAPSSKPKARNAAYAGRRPDETAYRAEDHLDVPDEQPGDGDGDENPEFGREMRVCLNLRSPHQPDDGSSRQRQPHRANGRFEAGSTGTAARPEREDGERHQRLQSVAADREQEPGNGEQQEFRSGGRTNPHLVGKCRLAERRVQSGSRDCILDTGKARHTAIPNRRNPAAMYWFEELNTTESADNGVSAGTQPARCLP